MKPMKTAQYSQNSLPMTKKKALLYLRQLLIVPTLILLLPLLVMRAVLARIGVLIAIFGLRIAKLAQLEDAWLISDLVLKESEQAALKWLRLMKLSQTLQYVYAQKVIKSFYRQQIQQLK